MGANAADADEDGPTQPKKARQNQFQGKIDHKSRETIPVYFKFGITESFRNFGQFNEPTRQ